MPANLTDVSTWTTPVQIPADGDAADLTYIRTGYQALANRTKWLYDFVNDEEWTYKTPKTRVVMVQPLALGGNTAGTGIGWDQGGGAPAYSRSTDNVMFLGVDLSPNLPSGAVLTQVRVRAKPGAARATSGNRLKLEVWRMTGSTGASQQLGSTVRDDGSTSGQWLTVTPGGGGEDIDRSFYTYAACLTSGNDGGSHQPDSMYAVELTFTDPGPRNA